MMARKETQETVKQQLAKIARLKWQGVSNTDLAKRYGVSVSFISQLLAKREGVCQ